MKLNRLIFIVCNLVLLPLISVHAQSVKDVTEDKSGRYIYSQARNADEKTAYDSALDELKSKVETYLKSKGQPDSGSVWTSAVRQIVTEKFGVYRVFLYVATENLVGGKETVTSVASQSKSDVTEKRTVPEAKAAAGNTDSTGIIESKAKVGEAAKQTEEKQAEAATYQKTNAGEAQAGEQPSGMIGDIIRMILEDGRPACVGNILEKGKSMRAVGLYGRADTKYANHAYLITLGEGRLYVYSPENQNGMRTEYSSGETSDNIKGKMIYWFLTK